MDYRYDIKTFDGEYVNVVVEIPKGSRNKYEIDEASGDKLTVVRELNRGYLSKFLGHSFGLSILKDYRYPFNYGFIPSTYADDKDQVDAIILGADKLDPLTVVKCKVVGVIKTIDKGEQDDKILVIPVYSSIKTININKIFKFLKNYKYPNQNSTKIGDIYNAAEAIKVINENRLYMNK